MDLVWAFLVASMAELMMASWSLMAVGTLTIGADAVVVLAAVEDIWKDGAAL